jgi:hypothetical protein
LFFLRSSASGSLGSGRNSTDTCCTASLEIKRKTKLDHLFQTTQLKSNLILLVILISRFSTMNYGHEDEASLGDISYIEKKGVRSVESFK